MTGRLILKVIGVLTLVSISIVALAVILLVGWFLLAMIFPNRMNVIGRVTDSAGRPIKAAQVHAVPLAIFDAHSEDSTKPARGNAQTVFTDEHGRFRFERLIASGGVKEGMWLQEYDISIKAEGYRPAKIRVHNSCDRHIDLITLEDIVLEKEKPLSANWKPETDPYSLKKTPAVPDSFGDSRFKIYEMLKDNFQIKILNSCLIKWHNDNSITRIIVSVCDIWSNIP